MTAEWLYAGGSVLVLLVLSAFFSGSETALTASSEPRMHELARQGSTRAQIVIALQERKPRLIGAILLGSLTYDANLVVIRPGRRKRGDKA